MKINRWPWGVLTVVSLALLSFFVLYPLAVHNALAMAMNRAADLGMPQVTADLLRGV